METIGQRVKRLRESRGWTQAQMMEKMDVSSATTISRIENGVTKDMRMPMAKKLADIFSVTPEYIMYGEDINKLYPTEVYNFIMNPENAPEIEVFVREQIVAQMKEDLKKKKGGN